jgi:hypothetical protein
LLTLELHAEPPEKIQLDDGHFRLVEVSELAIAVIEQQGVCFLYNHQAAALTLVPYRCSILKSEIPFAKPTFGSLTPKRMGFRQHTKLLR